MDAWPTKHGVRYITLFVEDLDATCAMLTARGVALINGPIDRPWGVRTACFADPGGHLWEIAQTLPKNWPAFPPAARDDSRPPIDARPQTTPRACAGARCRDSGRGGG